MIGERIKALRIERKMTQKELASRLFVTAQAVSRWENGEVEPSVSTVAKIAEIFHVSTDVLMGTEAIPHEQTRAENEYREAPRVPLAICGLCNHPIYESADIRRYGEDRQIICRKCHDRREQTEHNRAVSDMRRARIFSYIFGGLAALACLIIGLVMLTGGQKWEGIAVAVAAIPIFTLVSCTILDNNIVHDAMDWIRDLALVRWPGLIFDLSLDGIIWLLTVKLAMWIIELLLIFFFGAIALFVGGALSLFVYPYAIVHSVRNPEDD